MEKFARDFAITRGTELIREERVHQILDQGYDSEHDAQHDDRELAVAAEQVLMPHLSKAPGPQWVFDLRKKTIDDYEAALRRAGALIAAELDRINKT